MADRDAAVLFPYRSRERERGKYKYFEINRTRKERKITVTRSHVLDYIQPGVNFKPSGRETWLYLQRQPGCRGRIEKRDMSRRWKSTHSVENLVVLMTDTYVGINKTSSLYSSSWKVNGSVSPITIDWTVFKCMWRACVCLTNLPIYANGINWRSLSSSPGTRQIFVSSFSVSKTSESIVVKRAGGGVCFRSYYFY